MVAEAVLRTLRHVWQNLQAFKLPMAVMGGMALSVWKHVRATQDVDLLVNMEGIDQQELLEKLAAAEIYPKRHPPVLRLGQLEILQLTYEPPESFLNLQIDLLLANSSYHRQALERRITAKLPDWGWEIEVLTCEDLILHKLLAGRMIDRADVSALIQLNREALDWEYLFRWVQQLTLTSELSEAWEELYPTESLPEPFKSR